MSAKTIRRYCGMFNLTCVEKWKVSKQQVLCPGNKKILLAEYWWYPTDPRCGLWNILWWITGHCVVWLRNRWHIVGWWRICYRITWRWVARRWIRDRCIVARWIVSRLMIGPWVIGCWMIGWVTVETYIELDVTSSLWLEKEYGMFVTNTALFHHYKSSASIFCIVLSHNARYRLIQVVSLIIWKKKKRSKLFHQVTYLYVSIAKCKMQNNYLRQPHCVISLSHETEVSVIWLMHISG